MDCKLNIILQKLDKLDNRLEIIETEVKKVSKHVSFVDSLANSGIVTTINKLNNIISNINPLNMIKSGDTDDIKSIIDDDL